VSFFTTLTQFNRIKVLNTPNFNSELFPLIAQNNPNLTEFTYFGVSGFSGNDLKLLFQKCVHLKSIELFNVFHLDHDELIFIFNDIKLPQLHTIKLGYMVVTTEIVIAILNACDNLKQLILGNELQNTVNFDEVCKHNNL
jgi:hypothetical protein